MQIIATCSIWQQPSLVPTSQPFLSSFPCYTKTKQNTKTQKQTQKQKQKSNCTGRQWSQQVIKTKQNKAKQKETG